MSTETQVLWGLGVFGGLLLLVLLRRAVAAVVKLALRTAVGAGVLAALSCVGGVIGLNLGVAGAAAATVLSQVVSAVLVMMTLCRTSQVYRLQLKKIRFYGDMLVRIVRIGLPAGLQSVMYTSSNILIQSSVNALGTDTVAAWTAYSKIDSLFWMIVNAFGISITTFVGQNYGAGKWTVYTRECVPVWELRRGQPYCCP